MRFKEFLQIDEATYDQFKRVKAGQERQARIDAQDQLRELINKLEDLKEDPEKNAAKITKMEEHIKKLDAKIQAMKG